MSVRYSLISVQNEMRIDNQSIFEQVKYSRIQYQFHMYFSLNVDKRNHFLHIQKRSFFSLALSLPHLF
jgi:hypothetical protein